MVQDRILDRSLTADLVDQRLLTTIFVVISLVDDQVAVDIATLIWDALSFNDVHRDDIVLVELLGPPLWNSVFDLVLDHELVWTLGKCLCKRLLVQLIELVVELGDHVLDVGTLFFSVKTLEDSNLHVLFSEGSLMHECKEWILREDIFDLCVFVACKHAHVSLINLIDQLWIDQELCALHGVTLTTNEHTISLAVVLSRWLLRVVVVLIVADLPVKGREASMRAKLCGLGLWH